MASYKVPQDVEADDKILGPFSFRQFIYLMIVAAGIGLGWALFVLFPPLAIIPLPVVIFFGALALPLRKDQPMEMYLAAILSFHLKPRLRLWDPDGIESLVQISAPRTSEPQRTKGVSGSEAESRLRYLSDLSDTRGWSVRGVAGPVSTSLNEDAFNEAQQAQDILDEDSKVSQNLDYMIAQSDQRRHQETLSRFQSAAASSSAAIDAPQPAPAAEPSVFTTPDPYAQLSSSAPQPAVQTTLPPEPATAPQFNPYPTSMNQAVIQPLSEQSRSTPAPQPAPAQPTDPATPASTSAKGPSPDIIKLASNTDLSIETIAREAHRITEKELSLGDEEVVISLR